MVRSDQVPRMRLCDERAGQAHFGYLQRPTQRSSAGLGVRFSGWSSWFGSSKLKRYMIEHLLTIICDGISDYCRKNYPRGSRGIATVTWVTVFLLVICLIVFLFRTTSKAIF
jgi:hypothetical protein